MYVIGIYVTCTCHFVTCTFNHVSGHVICVSLLVMAYVYHVYVMCVYVVDSCPDHLKKSNLLTLLIKIYYLFTKITWVNKIK